MVPPQFVPGDLHEVPIDVLSPDIGLRVFLGSIGEKSDETFADGDVDRSPIEFGELLSNLPDEGITGCIIGENGDMEMITRVLMCLFRNKNSSTIEQLPNGRGVRGNTTSSFWSSRCWPRAIDEWRNF